MVEYNNSVNLIFKKYIYICILADLPTPYLIFFYVYCDTPEKIELVAESLTIFHIYLFNTKEFTVVSLAKRGSLSNKASQSSIARSSVKLILLGIIFKSHKCNF